MPIPHPDEPLLFYPPPPTRIASTNATGSGNWGPYSVGGSDFAANMAIILAAILCIIVLALSLGAVIRLLLIRRQSRRRRPSEDPGEPAPPPLPTVLFSSAETRLAGAGVECAICLTVFAEGDAVRVLPACNHGFHVRCVERWLAARSSCPTCRRTCDGADVAEQGGKGRGPSEQVVVPVEGLNEQLVQ